MTIVTQRDTLRQFERPTVRSWAQLLSTSAGLATGWILADLAMRSSLWLGAAASLVISVFSVRAFIIFHDCGHGSFSRSRRVNTVVGTAMGVVVLTPFAQWSRDHAKHHATSGDLDRRGAGDVWTMTTDEYRAASPRQRLYYRAYRNPVIMMSVAPLIKFLVVERFVTKPGRGRRRIKFAVYLTNLSIVGFVVTMGWWMGPAHYLTVQLIVVVTAGAPAVFLFYVQHSFPGTYWRRHPEWDYTEAALGGSSRVVLPRFFQWVTGNIGFHHIHHLAPRIPNYSLPKAQAASPEVQPGSTLTLRSSLGALRANLWDERANRYVSFSEVGL
jgi:acyl-lipid omega-6 desaturase (Delta-12 desaturase)